MRYIDLDELLKKRCRWGSRKELWRNAKLQSDFREYFFNKCWYSEIRLVGQDCHIDHFRPKAKVVQYKNYNYNRAIQSCGYHWMKNDPRNYRASCIYANRKTGEGGKACFFPLADDSEYLTEGGEEKEIPMLLDPCKEDDVKLLSFMGNTVVSTSEDPFDQSRVEISAEIYNLKNSHTKADISRIWDEVEKTIVEWENDDISLKACIRRLKDCTDKAAQFSSCAIACVNSLAPDELKKHLDLKL